MKKYFLLILLLIVYSCSDNIVVSPKQNTFYNTLKEYKNKYKSASTEAKQTKIKKERENYINSQKNEVIDNWYGQVISVTSTYVEVNHNGIKYTLEPTTEIDFTIFEINDKLLFSGFLYKLYFWDSPLRPGFYIKCHSITSYDKDVTYFSSKTSTSQDNSPYGNYQASSSPIIKSNSSIQNDFSNDILSFKQRYISATTDARKSKIRTERSDFIESKKKIDVINWYGKVIDATSTYLEVEHNDIKYTLEPTGDLDYSIFSLGEDLLFTGILHRKYAFDTPKRPGFYIKSHIITNFNKSKTYLSSKKYSPKVYNGLKNVVGTWYHQKSQIMGGYRISSSNRFLILKDDQGDYLYELKQTTTDEMYGGIPQTEYFIGALDNIIKNGKWYFSKGDYSERGGYIVINDDYLSEDFMPSYLTVKFAPNRGYTITYKR